MHATYKANIALTVCIYSYVRCTYVSERAPLSRKYWGKFITIKTQTPIPFPYVARPAPSVHRKHIRSLLVLFGSVSAHSSFRSFDLRPFVSHYNPNTSSMRYTKLYIKCASISECRRVCWNSCHYFIRFPFAFASTATIRSYPIGKVAHVKHQHRWIRTPSHYFCGTCPAGCDGLFVLWHRRSHVYICGVFSPTNICAVMLTWTIAFPPHLRFFHHAETLRHSDARSAGKKCRRHCRWSRPLKRQLAHAQKPTLTRQYLYL